MRIVELVMSGICFLVGLGCFGFALPAITGPSICGGWSFCLGLTEIVSQSKVFPVIFLGSAAFFIGLGITLVRKPVK